ncbi:glycosyltransferase family 2 protein [Paenibacillus sp. URB8-2]|uniref:glycosyltransferase family 2 protein n=1 Tax=Paenibacillus sp. URB8-2 TaxID=2741301 RepID=UPI0015BBC903|nr:glycosyltransferase family 2 protein [Paenibacillus sp. URB8-2]BCG60548.1 hypothetical protein PUR_39730 [Paenibacillus sp. URB8-2]
MVKFSVVIPVYKVEQYIHQCIDSVLNQSYINIEIILVDDGSPDNCPSICDSYKQSDSRVHVIHKNNGGLSSARNVGMSIASGEYIVFLDSDDWLDVDFFDKLSKRILRQDLEILVVHIKSYYDKNNFYRERKYLTKSSEIYSGVEVFEFLYNQADFWGAAWQFVVKRSFLIENKLKFVEGIYHEDERYGPELLLTANKIGFCYDSFYVNRAERKGSIINSHKLKKETDKLFILNDLLMLAQSEKFKGVKGDLILSRCAQLYLGLIKSSYKYYQTHKKEMNQFNKQLQSKKYVLKYNKNRKYKLLFIAVNIFGIKVIGKLFNRL